MGYNRPQLYNLTCSSKATIDPGDSKTYYFDQGGYGTEDPNYYSPRLPVAGQIVGVHLWFSIDGVLATAEDATVSIRLNNTTDYPVGLIKLNAQNNHLIVNNLNIPVASTDTYHLKLVCPAWATNPTWASWTINILINTA